MADQQLGKIIEWGRLGDPSNRPVDLEAQIVVYHSEQIDAPSSEQYCSKVRAYSYPSNRSAESNDHHCYRIKFDGLLKYASF